jgi:hypothetical protein
LLVGPILPVKERAQSLALQAFMPDLIHLPPVAIVANDHPCGH